VYFGYFSCKTYNLATDHKSTDPFAGRPEISVCPFSLQPCKSIQYQVWSWPSLSSIRDFEQPCLLRDSGVYLDAIDCHEHASMDERKCVCTALLAVESVRGIERHSPVFRWLHDCIGSTGNKEGCVIRRLSSTFNVLQNGTQVLDSSEAVTRHLAKIFIASTVQSAWGIFSELISSYEIVSGS
jgi:hypothetical protein